MQSLVAARCVLNVVALGLACLAVSMHSWSVVEPAVTAHHAPPRPGTGNASTEGAPQATTTPFIADARLMFAPSEYCLHYGNGTTDCHTYASLLARLGDATPLAPKPRTAPAATMTVDDVSDLRPVALDSPVARVEEAVSSWCMVGNGASDSWLLMGAQSMACLVILETCVCTKFLWLVVVAASALLSVLALRADSSFEGPAAAATYAHAALSVLLVLEWWGYSLYFIDIGYIALLQLVAHYGASFHLILVTMVLALIAGRLSLRLAGDGSGAPANPAKLHHVPLPTQSPTSSEAARSPSSEEGDVALDSLEASDPLTRPANYRV